ncbi:MAG: hypothetical protein QOD72_140 [Acidimicrobiaceae bacterium]|jgi:hypothetical protein|nr:hypothetical protein [Acidimicrobiaceae bacterium]
MADSTTTKGHDGSFTKYVIDLMPRAWAQAVAGCLASRTTKPR